MNKGKNVDVANLTARMLSLQEHEGGFTGKNYSLPFIMTPKMIRRRRVMLLLLSIVVFAAGGAVGAKIEKRRLNPNPVIAEINDTKIYTDDFTHQCEVSAGATVLQNMVSDELMYQFARQNGKLPSQEAVDAKFDVLAKDPDFYNRMHAANQTQGEYKQQLRIQMTREAMLGAGVQITDAEVKQFYAQNTDPHNPRALFCHPGTITVQVIISGELADLNQALKEYKAGVSFTDLVAKYSKDSSRANQGVMTLRQGQINSQKFPGVEQMLFTLEPGEVSKPSRIGNGWWIVRCMNRTAMSVEPFDKVAAGCREALIRLKGIQNNLPTQQAEDEFDKKAKVSVFSPRYPGIRKSANPATHPPQ